MILSLGLHVQGIFLFGSKHPVIDARQGAKLNTNRLSHLIAAERQRAGEENLSCLFPAPNK